VQNSTLFSNYAVVASLDYISNQGRIIIESSDISFNKAISIGILEIVDSTVTSTFTNNTVYSNMSVTKEVTIKELDDPTILSTYVLLQTDILRI
jgi:ABC-type branched-subunit amino acid transport system ATPase component